MTMLSICVAILSSILLSGSAQGAVMWHKGSLVSVKLNSSRPSNIHWNSGYGSGFQGRDLPQGMSKFNWRPSIAQSENFRSAFGTAHRDSGSSKVIGRFFSNKEDKDNSIWKTNRLTTHTSSGSSGSSLLPEPNRWIPGGFYGLHGRSNYDDLSNLKEFGPKLQNFHSSNRPPTKVPGKCVPKASNNYCHDWIHFSRGSTNADSNDESSLIKARNLHVFDRPDLRPADAFDQKMRYKLVG